MSTTDTEFSSEAGRAYEEIRAEEASARNSLRWKYGQFVEQSTSSSAPRFCNFFQRQSERHRELGRAAVFEYLENQPAQVTTFKTSTDLEMYLESHPRTNNNRSLKRLFLLEDLPRNYIEVLGSSLLIPPLLFAAHWSSPEITDYSEQSYNVQFSPCGFLIKYAHVYKLDKSNSWLDCGNPAIAANSNVERSVYFDQNQGLENEKEFVVMRKVSFWSNTRSKSSWDALILMDPALSLLSLRSTLVQLRPAKSFYPPLLGDTNIPVDPVLWTDSKAVALNVSMFDDILALHSSGLHRISTDPFSCTILCRKLSISNTTIYCKHLKEKLIHSIVAAGTYGPLQRVYYNNPIAKMQKLNWDLARSSSSTKSLVGVKFCISKCLIEVDRTISALNLEPTAMQTMISRENDWERLGWKMIRESLLEMQQILDLFLQSLRYESTIKEAQQSNGIARSVSEITTLASIFLPISVVASIFSMGDNFLPGGSLFWVFWTVAGPLCILIGLYTWRAHCFMHGCNGSRMDPIRVFRRALKRQESSY